MSSASTAEIVELWGGSRDGERIEVPELGSVIRITDCGAPTRSVLESDSEPRWLEYERTNDMNAGGEVVYHLIPGCLS